jgi:hypothetical protein
VRLRVRAILVARVFFRASVFNVRTSDRVHERRFPSLDIYQPPSDQWTSKIFGVGDWTRKGAKLSHGLLSIEEPLATWELFLPKLRRRRCPIMMFSLAHRSDLISEQCGMLGSQIVRM